MMERLTLSRLYHMLPIIENRYWRLVKIGPNSHHCELMNAVQHNERFRHFEATNPEHALRQALRVYGTYLRDEVGLYLNPGCAIMDENSKTGVCVGHITKTKPGETPSKNTVDKPWLVYTTSKQSNGRFFCGTVQGNAEGEYVVTVGAGKNKAKFIQPDHESAVLCCFLKKTKPDFHPNQFKDS